MFLQKIKSRESGILVYGITPPKKITPSDKVVESAKRTIERVKSLPIDALIVYDVQDESTRTKEERPFPFQASIDPLAFVNEHLNELAVEKIIYRPAGIYSEAELSEWFKNLQEQKAHPVLVGIPSPDYVPQSTLTKAYELWWKYKETSVVGAISIPERHIVLGDEDQRMLDKIKSGVSYFVTQCVFNEDYSMQMLEALAESCKKNDQQAPTVIFTLSTCGSTKILGFLEWLGIHIKEEHKARLLNSANILEDSIDLCFEIADILSNYCIEKNIPFGFNIESVAIKKEEIEASITLLKELEQMLKSKMVSAE